MEKYLVKKVEYYIDGVFDGSELIICFPERKRSDGYIECFTNDGHMDIAKSFLFTNGKNINNYWALKTMKSYCEIHGLDINDFKLTKYLRRV